MSGYWVVPVKMRAQDVTEVDVSYDGTTAGKTWDFTDMPSDAFMVSPEAENAVITGLNGGDSTPGHNGRFKLYGWPDNGAGQFIADVSATCGSVFVGDVTTDFYIDSFVVDVGGAPFDASASDVGSNHPARLGFKTCGLKYLYPSFIDLTAQTTVNLFCRTF